MSFTFNINQFKFADFIPNKLFHLHVFNLSLSLLRSPQFLITILMRFWKKMFDFIVFFGEPRTGALPMLILGVGRTFLGEVLCRTLLLLAVMLHLLVFLKVVLFWKTEDLLASIYSVFSFFLVAHRKIGL